MNDDKRIIVFGDDPEPEKTPEAVGVAEGVEEVQVSEVVNEDVPSSAQLELEPTEAEAAATGTEEAIEDAAAELEAAADAIGASAGDIPADEVAESELGDDPFGMNRFSADIPVPGAGDSGEINEGTKPEFSTKAPTESKYAIDEQEIKDHMAHSTPAQGAPRKQAKAKKEPKYVTRTALVLCLILTMVVSSTVSAVLAVLLSRTYSTGTRISQNLTESSQSTATGSNLTVAEIIDKNENAVVEIVTSGTTTGFYGQQQLTEGAGSGVIVKSDGYIVTNYHVIEGATKVQVKLHNGDSYSAQIIGGDANQDIAVIKIDAKNLSVATIGDSSTVDVGDLAVAIGNPLGQLGGTATSGIISALDRQLTIEGRTMTLIQTDAAINAGNSGGGLFNGEGNLIGIVDAKSSGTGIEGLAFAIPINQVKDTIDDYIQHGGKAQSKAPTPAIGITISDISEDNAQYYNLEGAGVYVTQVTGQNAMEAGFQAGDKIIFLDKEAVTDANDLITKVRKHKVGDVVSVTVSRQGQQITIKTELEDVNTASGQAQSNN